LNEGKDESWKGKGMGRSRVEILVSDQLGRRKWKGEPISLESFLLPRKGEGKAEALVPWRDELECSAKCV